MTAERLAELFHASIERRYAYFQPPGSASVRVPWARVPDNIQRLLISSSREVLSRMAQEDAEVTPHA